MKIYASLTLLATLTAACGGSKGSDNKGPEASTTPVVTVNPKVETITPKPTPSETETSSLTETNNQTSVETVSNNNNTSSNNSSNNNSSSNNSSTETQVVETTKPAPAPETFVGFGYNSTTNQVKENCRTSEVILDGSNSRSEVSFQRFESYDSFTDNVLQAAQGSVLNNLVGNEFKAKYFNELTESSLNSTYVFASSITLGTRRVVKSTLNAHQMNPLNFLNKCGNGYIESAVVGGTFVAGVTLSFTKEEYKDAAEEETLSYSQLTQMLAQQSTWTHELRTVSSVQISFTQIGGGGLLPSHLPTEKIMSCSIGSQAEVQQCIDVLNKLASYTTSESFRSSIQASPAVFSFTLGAH